MLPIAIPEIPLSLVAPAAATTFAYLNAKYSLFYDVNLIGGLLKTIWRSSLALRRDNVNLFYVLEQHALAPGTKDAEFIVYNGRAWTFHETYVTVLRYGSWFQKVHGVKPKDVVAIDFMNSSTFIFLVLGLWSIGAVPAFINYNLSGKPLTHCIRVSTARLLVVDEEVRPCYPPEQLETLASPDFRDGKGAMEVVFFTPEVEAQISQMEATRQEDTVRAGVVLRDMAMLIYTSGTTGLPKPAIISWRKCWNGGVFIPNWLSLSQGDRIFTCMPLYHSSACILGFGACLMSGTTLIIGRKFSARSFWREARESHATIVQYVGETLRYLLAVPPSIDPATGEDLDKKHNIRIAFGNGLRPDIWNRFKERFNVPTVGEFYAATEGTSGSWNLSSNDFSAGAIGRNGRLSSLILGGGVQVVQVDHESQEPWRDPKTGFCKVVPRGEPGELLWAVDAGDPSEKFQGYFNNSKATEGKILFDVLRKGDAFFRTGDMVRWDAEGRWYFNDRLGDTFRWKSENVSTSEVAEILGAHADVQEANVYGVALPNHDGRAGCAAVVLEQQLHATDPSVLSLPSPSTLESLASHVLKSLPRYAVPLFLRFTPQMQATGNYKQQKHVLRTEGVDPSLVNASDKIYWLQENTYVPFGQKDWTRLQGGQVKL
ncbi:hypothetical protein EYZ11_004061 [Aspergillus tanneri]|uniref:Very long-chain fatty acid transport protein n=1 Tax=Aspergillus tanneri TaxID=1220188 RepID=A0A4S3JM31_9EURO|nr:uncharacterized protein ATNIH1004_006128 [Aspergillus tanneri]KAA8647435.1 hypothetical protein ATNIH1004_006128 [Aspergillus tanneri]THC96470.1 hypothetical protein EYZ11_004061 [Aspergillus tanneri]